MTTLRLEPCCPDRLPVFFAINLTAGLAAPAALIGLLRASPMAAALRGPKNFINASAIPLGLAPASSVNLLVFVAAGSFWLRCCKVGPDEAFDPSKDRVLQGPPEGPGKRVSQSSPHLQTYMHESSALKRWVGSGSSRLPSLSTRSVTGTADGKGDCNAIGKDNGEVIPIFRKKTRGLLFSGPGCRLLRLNLLADLLTICIAQGFCPSAARSRFRLCIAVPIERPHANSYFPGARPFRTNVQCAMLNRNGHSFGLPFAVEAPDVFRQHALGQPTAPVVRRRFDADTASRSPFPRPGRRRPACRCAPVSGRSQYSTRLRPGQPDHRRAPEIATGLPAGNVERLVVDVSRRLQIRLRIVVLESA